MFEFLFRYPRQTFASAEWFLASAWGWIWLVVAFAVAACLVIVSLRRQPLSGGRRAVVGLLQMLVIGGLLVLLWQPSLRAERVQAGENAVALMLDTSRSMQHREGNATRLDNVLEALGQYDTLERLGELFATETLAVADTVTPYDFASDISAGRRSRLGSALTEVLESASERSLAGVVLLSDGAETDARSSEWWQALTEYQVPVYTVAASSEPPSDDRALSAVDLPPQVGAGSAVTARFQVRYSQSGEARLRVLDGNRLLVATTLNLPADQTRYSGSIEFGAGEPGLRDLRFELTPLADESNTTNNAQRRVLDVRSEKRRILYVEGEPRWEYKFMRRAVHDSPTVELVGLLHTSPNKFYRQGVRNAQELEDGFPADRETLFTYDAIIIGSLDAAMLNAEQQENLREFVRTRGGSLMMLGGTSGLGDGGWARTVVASALPADIDTPARSFQRARADTRITELGLKTPWLHFSDNVVENLRQWDELPALADLHQTGPAKAGATVLLQADLEGEQLPLLTWQRYGRGKSFILATGGTWRWQMSLPSDDQRHETFWQGLLEELTSGVLPRVTLVTDRTNYRDEARVAVELTVRDQRFEHQVETLPTVALTAPDGTETPLTLQADPNQPGRFSAVADAPLTGEYRLAAYESENPEAVQQQWVVREDNIAEDFALYPDPTYLQRVAEETGGQYLTLDQLGQLPELLQQSQTVLVRKEILPLWNLPAVFLLLLMLKLFEYLIRWRWKRL